MPKRAAASTLVVAATKCSAISPPPPCEEPGLRGRRVGHRLLGGEGLAGDDEERLGRRDAAQHRGDVVAVDVGDEVQLEPRMGERRERRDRHLRPEVAAADADVDDVAQRPRAALGPRPHRLGEGEHRLARGMHLVGERCRARRRAQGGVQHRPAFGDVDRLAREHRVAPGLDAAFARQVERGSAASPRRCGSSTGRRRPRAPRRRSARSAPGRGRRPRAGRDRGRGLRSGRAGRPRRRWRRNAGTRSSDAGRLLHRRSMKPKLPVLRTSVAASRAAFIAAR